MYILKNETLQSKMVIMVTKSSKSSSLHIYRKHKNRIKNRLTNRLTIKNGQKEPNLTFEKGGKMLHYHKSKRKYE